jgi:hypothetical protein
MTKEIVRYLGLALVVIAVLIVTLQSGNSLRYVDESDYEQLARSIVHRHNFSFDGQSTMSRPPGYPGVIALVYTAIESPLAAKLANTVFLALAILALGFLAKRIEPRADALVPYLVLAYPLLIYAASVLYPQILGCLLLAVIVGLIAADNFTLGRALIAGILYGVLILAIPYFLLLLPLFAIFVCLRDGKLRGRSIQLAALLFVTSVIVVGIWTVRNFREFHVLVPVSANNGINLLIGNSAIAKPNSGVTADLLEQCPAWQPDMSEYDKDAITRKCAFDWISRHPSDALQLYLLKVLNYFNFRNELATASEQSHWRDWLVFMTYYPLLLISLARAAAFRRIPFTRAETMIYVLYFANAVASAIFFTRLRFRIPFDFMLIGVNAAFLMRLWRSYRAHRQVSAGQERGHDGALRQDATVI